MLPEARSVPSDVGFGSSVLEDDSETASYSRAACANFPPGLVRTVCRLIGSRCMDHDEQLEDAEDSDWRDWLGVHRDPDVHDLSRSPIPTPTENSTSTRNGSIIHFPESHSAMLGKRRRSISGSVRGQPAAAVGRNMRTEPQAPTQ